MSAHPYPRSSALPASQFHYTWRAFGQYVFVIVSHLQCWFMIIYSTSIRYLICDFVNNTQFTMSGGIFCLTYQFLYLLTKKFPRTPLEIFSVRDHRFNLKGGGVGDGYGFFGELFSVSKNVQTKII